MEQVFGEAGRHARSAVGVPVLPLGAAVEIDAIVAVKPAELTSTRLIARPFAHRGLHGAGVIENSRAAFEAAIAAGPRHRARRPGERRRRGDGLPRLRAGPADRAATGWSCAMLGGGAAADPADAASDETIPTLAEILALIGGRAPLLIEVKSPDRRRRPR